MARRFQKLLMSGAGTGLVGGLEYMALVAILVVVGMILDEALGTGPLLTVVFAVVGFVGGFLRIMYADAYDQARRAFRGLPPKSQREVPDILEEKERERTKTGAGGQRPLFDSQTGLTSFKDWNPRRYGDAVPPELDKDVDKEDAE